MLLTRRNPRPGRRGAAAVEFAICLPVLTLLIFGSIQACDLIYLRHGLMSAAYEGSLELSRPNATNALVEARIGQVLEVHDIESGSSSLGPGTVAIADATPGDEVVVTVTAPAAGNLALTKFFATPDVVTATLTCTR